MFIKPDLLLILKGLKVIKMRINQPKGTLSLSKINRKSSVGSRQAQNFTLRRTSSSLFEFKKSKISKSKKHKQSDTKKRRENVRVYLRSLYSEELNDLKNHPHTARNYESNRSAYSNKSFNKKAAHSTRSIKSLKSSHSRGRRSKSPLNPLSSRSARPSPSPTSKKSFQNSSKTTKIKGILKKANFGKNFKEKKVSPRSGKDRNFTAKCGKKPSLGRKKSSKDLRVGKNHFMNPN